MSTEGEQRRESIGTYITYRCALNSFVFDMDYFMFYYNF